MDHAPQTGDFALPGPVLQESSLPAELPESLWRQLWLTAEAESCGLTLAEFSAALEAVGAKYNYGHPPGINPGVSARAKFLQSLHLAEFAIAQACSLGRDAAWQLFLRQYRAALTQAAVAVAGNATLGHDLADSLYAELYGLNAADGIRRSPLASYSGRGSLLGWLRTTLAQRHVDRHRKTHREVPLDDTDPTTATPSPQPISADLQRLTGAIARTLKELSPEDRFLLSAYFLDSQTLLKIAHLLRVHEATVSRRIKRLTEELRKKLLVHLQSGGLSRRAAEELLGIDPRDLEINLRQLLQTSQITPFSDKTIETARGAS